LQREAADAGGGRTDRGSGVTARFGRAREAAFLRALARCGNLTLAAEGCGVSRSWVGLRRKECARFDEAVRRTLDEARDRLEAAAANGPGLPEDLRLFGVGAALTVRGIGGTGAGSRGRRVQVGRARARQWTAAVEQRFLGHLEATCNVKAATAAMGLSHSGAYAHRYRWAGFARAWDEALARGSARLEAALLEGWCDPPGEAAEAEAPPVEPMSAEQALELLKLHRLREAGWHKGRRRETPEALRAVLGQRIAQLRTQMTNEP
jgi:hypothetical protein